LTTPSQASPAISSLVSSRFGGTAANVSVRQVVSFAPTSASGRTNEAFAANPAGAGNDNCGLILSGEKLEAMYLQPLSIWCHAALVTIVLATSSMPTLATDLSPRLEIQSVEANV
jgi:hypothetical protein